MCVVRGDLERAEQIVLKESALRGRQLHTKARARAGPNGCNDPIGEMPTASARWLSNCLKIRCLRFGIGAEVLRRPYHDIVQPALRGVAFVALVPEQANF